MGTTRTRRHLLSGRGGVQRLLAALRRRGRPENVPDQAFVQHWERSHRSLSRTFVRAGAAAVLVVGALAGATATAETARAATSGPCDLYAAGGTPCVAAHSTTRALYASYTGPLYQVRRASDNTTRDVGVLSAGGYADAAAQDSFCAGTTCLITILYDQSGRGNHLTQAPGGGAAGGPDNLANATAAPTTVGGHKAYGVFVAPGTGYRNNHTNGIATGDNPEGMYAIFDGTHYNGGCCFDYGNAETSNNDDGNGTMEAIYFGNIKVWGYGAGNGPWIMADLENGLFSGVNQHYNAGDPTINHRYTTAVIKGGPNHWAIRGGNAQSGGLSTFYDGPRPNVAGYNPMRKQGAIILGIGGDNSKGAQGTFYEGVMTSGYPSDATENAVQANITAAGYSNASGGASTGALHAVGAGKCLDVPNSSTTAGTQPQIWDCSGAANQTWTRTSSNQLTVYSGSSQMCLDAYDNQTSAGTKVETWPCNGGANQQWQLNSNGTITGTQSGLCLDVTGASTANGALAELWTCNGGSNQQWNLS
ncbi:ricin-type beta-trefoil lectin domain protein [Streptomyces sp. Go40/10]|uniref:arabinofuranosidase catalytic domain-containing protein n=1 Tax=Streptomyces sp. Go40/10 TaxID=2825844 RepID=UPI001E33DD98|nr:arabinofuranosidase catalytic domain-containing protein [Streptomyces sp. Go40/10]UFR01329.1 ricin-type beta-trefoil lectin domain protein [Streptomyces sp. Go40/10]